MEQYNDKEGIEESMEIARLRFGMIAPVIQKHIRMSLLCLLPESFQDSNAAPGWTYSQL